jgi:hypothetical protein
VVVFALAFPLLDLGLADYQAVSFRLTRHEPSRALPDPRPTISS